MDGQPTQEKLGLPLPSYPPTMKEMMDKTITKQEYELKRTEEDMIVENVEVYVYLMLIQMPYGKWYISKYHSSFI